MKKLNISILGFFLILVQFLHLQARDNQDSYLGDLLVWPTYQINPVASVAKKSNITLQEIQKLQECNNQVSKRNREARSRVAYSQDSSFQKIMDKRSKAFESSINNSIFTLDHNLMAIWKF